MMDARGIRPHRLLVTPELETEAAIWAEGTDFTKADLLAGYIDWLEYDPYQESFEWWCMNVMKIPNTTPKEVGDG
jgi:hypothetical protein